MIKQIVEVLTSVIPPKDKVRLILSLNNHKFLALILSSAYYFNESVSDLRRFKNSLTITEGGDISLEDVKILIKQYFEIGESNLIVSLGSWKAFSVFISPGAIGLSRAAISAALDNKRLSLDEVEGYLGLEPSHEAATACGICNRVMISTDDVNVCGGCKQLLQSYATNRRGAFLIEINKENIPNLSDTYNDLEIEFRYLDYVGTKIKDIIWMRHHTEYYGPSIQLPLPFEENQRQIVNFKQELR